MRTASVCFQVRHELHRAGHTLMLCSGLQTLSKMLQVAFRVPHEAKYGEQEIDFRLQKGY